MTEQTLQEDAAANERLDELTRTVVQQELELRAAWASLAERQKVQDRLESDLAQARYELENEIRTGEDYRRQIEEGGRTKDAHLNRIKELEAQFPVYEERNSALSAQFAEAERIRAAHLAHIAGLERRFAELTAERDVLSQQLLESAAVRQIVQAELDREVQRAASLLGQLEEAQAVRRDHLAHITRLEADWVRETQRSERLHAQLVESQRAGENSGAVIEGLNTALQQAEVTRAAHIAEIERLRSPSAAPRIPSATPPLRTQQFMYHVLCSRRCAYTYVFVPKAACTTIKAALWLSERRRDKAVGSLADRESVHVRQHDEDSPWLTYGNSPIQEMSVALGSRRFLFSVVRNPYSRVFSAYRNTICKVADVGTFDYKAQIGWLRQENPTFEEFLSIVSGQERSQMNEHWRPMSDLLLIDQVGYDRIYAVETLQADLKGLLSRAVGSPNQRAGAIHLNATGSDQVKLAAYTPEAIRLVQAIYEEDFTRFGYAAEVAQAAPDPSVLAQTATGQGVSEDLIVSMLPRHLSS